jgi:heme O synthase-like polyprenyltransferase
MCNADWRSMRPAGKGRLAVRRILASTSTSDHWLSAPPAPAPSAMQRMAVKPRTNGGSAAVLSFVFLVLAARVAASKTTEPAQMHAEKHLFAYSVFYLFALFAVLVADRGLAW